MSIQPSQAASGEPTEAAVASASSRPITRWAIAIIAVVYGFSKLNGAQFTVLDSELDKPMGLVSGFWLAWHFFGYSTVYGNLIALLQIACGLLITQARLALAGALILLPIATNIVLVDVFYGVDLGGTIAGIVLLVLVLRIVVPHAPRLLDAVVPPSGKKGDWTWRAITAPIVLVVAAFGFTYWIAHYNNRAPTDVDGVWHVEGRTGEVERVFFERNRARKVVVKDTAGNYREHHFELEPEGRLRIWETWLSKGPLLYDGRYTPPDRVRLRRVGGSDGDELMLRRWTP